MNWTPLDYDAAAVIADDAGEEMFSRLDWMTIKPAVVVEMGCGTGKISARLKERYPDATVIGLDLSFPMLEYARNNQPLFVNADSTRLPLRDQSVDLIFANFLLPWTDPPAVLSECKRVLRPNGLLMVTALGLDTLQEWRSVIATEDIPRLMDMHDLGDMLLHMGYADPVLDVCRTTISYSTQLRFISELQAAQMWFPLPVEEKILAAFAPTPEGCWDVTFEVITAHAFAPELQTTAPSVSLDDLRQQLPSRKYRPQ